MKYLITIVLSFLILNISANNYLDSLKSLYNTSNEATTKIRTIKEIGVELRNRSSFYEGIEFFSEVISKTTGNSKTNREIIAISNTNLGIIYYYMGNHELSLKYAIDALKIYEELSKSEDMKSSVEGKKGAAYSYSNIGAIYLSREEYNTALDYFLLSLEINKELDIKTGLSDCYNNMGNVYFLQKNYDEALKYFSKALTINEEIKNSYGQSACYNNIALIYKQQYKYDTAISYFQKSLEIETKSDNKYGIALVCINIADLFITNADSIEDNVEVKIKSYLEAIAYGKIGYDLSLEINSLESVLNSTSTLMEAYQKLGNTYSSEKDYKLSSTYFNLAIEFATKNIEVGETIFAIEKNKALVEMQAKYNFEKKEKENLILKQELEISNYQQNILIIIIISGVVFIILILLNHRNYKRRKDVEKKKLLNELKIVKTETIINKSVDDLKDGKIDRNKIDNATNCKLNETDWKIINILYKNPLLTNKLIANEIFLSVDGVRSSLRKMYSLFEIEKVDNQKIALVIEIMKLSR
ncbi:MAG: tetratricopeptide repeat protein [Bacteroidales bacterium]|nr:tetratricopeptide repeat protein [Bacteroidales bacterium]